MPLRVFKTVLGCLLLIYLCVTHASGNTNCTDNYKLIGSKCYKFIWNVRRSWGEAHNYCVREQAHLVNIYDESQLNALGDFAADCNFFDIKRDDISFWTDGNDLMDLMNFRWQTTEQKINYSRWNVGEPSHSHNNEHCLHLSFKRDKQKFYMNDLNCATRIRFICEKERDIEVSVLQPNTSDLGCPSACFRHVANACYWIVVNQALNWYEAHMACQRVSSQLLVIETAAELTALQEYMKQNGIHKGTSGYWTAGTDWLSEGNYYWSNGMDMGYTKWLTGQPRGIMRNQNYVEITYASNNELYMSVRNSMDKNYYICERSFNADLSSGLS